MDLSAKQHRLQFHFEMDAVEDIVPWGEGDDRKLHWFGLTSGRYWLSTPLGEALRYTDAQSQTWGLLSPYVDYPVARLFEDLQQVLPIALEPVPADIAALVSSSAWFDQADEWIRRYEDRAERSDLCRDAMEWYADRALDTMYLIDGPLFHFWRTGDEVTIRWESKGERAEAMWSVPAGLFRVSAQEFASSAFRFFEEVLGGMQKRIEAIQANGWNRPDCRLDIPALVEEQRRRAALVGELKNRRPETDWESIRRFLAHLSAEFQRMDLV